MGKQLQTAQRDTFSKLLQAIMQARDFNAPTNLERASTYAISRVDARSSLNDSNAKRRTDGQTHQTAPPNPPVAWGVGGGRWGRKFPPVHHSVSSSENAYQCGTSYPNQGHVLGSSVGGHCLRPLQMPKGVTRAPSCERLRQPSIPFLVAACYDGRHHAFWTESSKKQPQSAHARHP